MFLSFSLISLLYSSSSLFYCRNMKNIIPRLYRSSLYISIIIQHLYNFLHSTQVASITVVKMVLSIYIPTFHSSFLFLKSLKNLRSHLQVQFFVATVLLSVWKGIETTANNAVLKGLRVLEEVVLFGTRDAPISPSPVIVSTTRPLMVVICANDCSVAASTIINVSSFFSINTISFLLVSCFLNIKNYSLFLNLYTAHLKLKIRASTAHSPLN